MNLVQSKSNIIEKVLRDKEGRLVRASFQVYENAGRLKARLLDFVYIDIPQIAGKILSIASAIKEAILKVEFSYEAPAFVFVKSKNLESSGTKPRAPTL